MSLKPGSGVLEQRLGWAAKSANGIPQPAMQLLPLCCSVSCDALCAFRQYSWEAMVWQTAARQSCSRMC